MSLLYKLAVGFAAMSVVEANTQELSHGWMLHPKKKGWGVWFFWAELLLLLCIWHLDPMIMGTLKMHRQIQWS